MLPLGRRPSKDKKDEDVLSGQDAWTTIDKTVRTVDEDKVKDCTDDIDTLLVFAGLYSAVLTAFLIESYKSLQPDSKEDLLRQIAFQTANYSFSGGYLNSTFSPSQLPPFQAALSDKRVNVCWFASLILSLSTASYGILVKQWLREYLAIDRTTPQERIRIRHFRARGLDVWRLFDIAAVLPVILQISLTLFFVGLCFFTAAVHPSIGTTSVCLVGGWAVVVFFAVLAPLLSARCPYKTTFLKSALTRLRPYVRPAVSCARSVILLPGYARSLSGHVLSLLGNTALRFPVLNRPLHVIRVLISSACRSITIWYKHAITIIQTPTSDSSVTSHSDADSDSKPRTDPFGDCLHVSVIDKLSKYVLEEDVSIQEEIKIRNSDSNDLVILQNVDSMLLDDDLLSRMRDALKGRPPPGQQVMKFAVAVIRHRLDVSLQERDIRSSKPEHLPWPWTLSLTVRTSLISLLANSVLLRLSKASLIELVNDGDFQWAMDAIMLIFTLSSPHTPLPKIATSMFERLLQEADGPTGTGRPGLELLAYQVKSTTEYTNNKRGASWLTHRVFTCIMDALKILDSSDAARALQCVAHWGYVGDGYVRWNGDTYDLLLAQTRPNDDSSHDTARATPETIVVLVEVAATILHTLTVEDSSKQELRRTVFTQSITSLLDFVLNAIPATEADLPDVDLNNLPHISGAIGLDRILLGLFTTPRLVYPFLEFFSTRRCSIASSHASSASAPIPNLRPHPAGTPRTPHRDTQTYAKQPPCPCASPTQSSASCRVEAPSSRGSTRSG